MSHPQIAWLLQSVDNVPANLRDPRDAALAMLDSFRARGVVEGDLTSQSAFGRYTAGHCENVVALLGGRGSGKTTLLTAVCAALLNRCQDLVLPITTPERFGSEDTLTGWILALIEECLHVELDGLLDEEPPPATSVDDRPITPPRSLRQQLTQLRLQEALTLRGFAEGLARQSRMGTDFALESIALTSTGATFADQWAQLVTRILAAVSIRRDNDANKALLVVPIDDADLCPGVLPRILVEMRLLSHPQVAFFVGGDPTSIEQALLAAALQVNSPRSNGGADNLGALLTANAVTLVDILEEMDKRIVKALPRQNRILLQPLAPIERLLFKPVGCKRSLLDLFEKFPLKGVPHFNRLHQLFDIASAIGETPHAPSMYVGCLSEVPRELEQLYRKVEQLVDVNSELKPLHTSEVVRTVIEHALSLSRRALPADHVPVRWYKSADGYDVEANYQGIYFGAERGPGTVIRTADVEGGRAAIAIRTCERYWSVPEHTGPQDDMSKIIRKALPEQFTYAMYLLAEALEDDAVLSSYGRYGSPSTPGGIAWDEYVRVIFAGAPCDNAFWLIPDWDCLSDYGLYVAGWNRLVHLCRDLREINFDYDERGDAVLEWVFMTHLEIICAVQESRTIPSKLREYRPASLWSEMLSHVDQSRKHFESATSTLGELLTRIYRASCAPMGDRDRRFRIWFELMLPWSCDRLCNSERTCQWLLDLHRSAVDNVARSGLVDRESVFRGLVKNLVSRVEQHLEAPWPRITLELLKHFDEGEYVRLHETWERLSRLKEASFLRRIEGLRGTGVPDATLKAIQQWGMSEATAKELLRAGVPSDYVEELMNLFSRGSAQVEEGDDAKSSVGARAQSGK